MRRSHQAGWLLVFLLTLLVGLGTVTFLFVFGLILVEFLLIPVALLITGLLTALVAVYASNKFVRDRLRSPAGEVVRRTEWTAATLALILVLAYTLNLVPGPAIIMSSLAGFVLAVSSVFFASRFRLPPDSLLPEGRKILVWLLVAVMALPVVILIASWFGLAGA